MMNDTVDPIPTDVRSDIEVVLQVKVMIAMKTNNCVETEGLYSIKSDTVA